MKIAHIINPVKISEASDLYVAQPITFESMRVAREFAKEDVEVELFSAQYPEDHGIIPDWFKLTRDLDRSILDIGQFNKERKLPLLTDILDRLYESSEAEYFIYTNVDIGVTPYFYVAVNKLIEDGYDSFVINRRSISEKYKALSELALMYSDVGESHKGYDCFVFRREDYVKYSLGTICLGIAWVGRCLLANLFVHSVNFYEFKRLHLTFHIGNSWSWKSDELKDYSSHNKNEYGQIIAMLEKESGKWNNKIRSYLVDGGKKREQLFDDNKS